MSDDQSGEPTDPTPPRAQQPPTPPGYGQAPPPGYGQATPPGYGQQPPNWGSAYPPPPQYPPPGYGYPYPQAPVPPKHGQATTAMVFGIVSVAGLFLCVVPILVAPVAWILGAKAVKEIDANPAAYSGRSEANAGKILGIIGTCLLVLALLALVAIIIIGVNGGFDPDPSDPYYSDAITGWLR